MTRSQNPASESPEAQPNSRRQPQVSPDTLRNQDRSTVEKKSMLRQIFIDAPLALVAAPFKWMGRHPVLTTLGVAALAYFGAPWLFGRYAAGEAAGAGAGVDWWRRFTGSLPRGPGLSPSGSLGGGLGGGYGAPSGSM